MKLRNDIGTAVPTPEEQDRLLAEEDASRDAAWQRLVARADQIRIIDFHTHTFPEQIAERALARLSQDSGSKPFTGGTVQELQASMREAGVDLSVV